MNDRLSSVDLRVLGTRATLAELEAINTTILKTGAQVFVADQSANYFLLKESTIPADGVNVVAPVASAGRWVVQPITSSSSVATQTTWFIDPQNTSGTASDGNDGETAATALLTYAELSRRFDGVVFQQSVTVTQTSSPALPGDVYSARTVQGGVAFGVLTFNGEAPTVSAPRVLTAAVDSDPVAGDEPTITVAGFDWTPFIGHRVRVTAGTNVGIYSWIIGTVGTVETAVVAQDGWDQAAFLNRDFTAGDTVVTEELTVGPGLAYDADGVWWSDNPITWNDFEFSNTSAVYLSLTVTNMYGCNLLMSPATVEPSTGGIWTSEYNTFAGCHISTLELESWGTLNINSCWCEINSIKSNNNTLFAAQNTFNRVGSTGNGLVAQGRFNQFNAMRFQDWTGAALVLTFGTNSWIAAARIWGTTTGANSFGIQCQSGSVFQFETGNNTPTVAGTLAPGKDVQIGGTSLDYATALAGYINPSNNAAFVDRTA